jgi:uncharacterized membrane protein
MLELAGGTLLLLLGWLCFGQASRVRAGYSIERGPLPGTYGEKPRMIVTAMLGALLVIHGLALLALAVFE